MTDHPTREKRGRKPSFWLYIAISCIFNLKASILRLEHASSRLLFNARFVCANVKAQTAYKVKKKITR